MTLPPSPEAQIDVQAIKARLQEMHDSMASCARHGIAVQADAAWLVPDLADAITALDAYEAQVREFASALQDAVDMAEALANAQAQIDALTAALDEARKEREHWRDEAYRRGYTRDSR
jgi:multidrug efflux pump subunit AcrA (membrane-fusion protein)